MRRKALILVLGCLFYGGSFAEDTNTTDIERKDNDSAATANQLISIIKDAPTSIYASAAPHGAYSFNAPSYQLPTKSAGVLLPVHTEKLVLHKQSGYLTDSYGNKYVETPKSVVFRTAHPQRYVSLQDLPAHLPKPVSPGVQFKHSVPHFSLHGPPIQLPSFQAAHGAHPPTSTSLKHFHGVSHIHGPIHDKHLAHSGFSHQKPGFPKPNTHEHLKPEPYNFQISEKPQSGQISNGNHELKQLLEVPTKTVVQNPNTIFSASTQQVKLTPVNNRQNPIELPTKPPVPHILDLSLLEPLVFDNPVVPQVQHYLPRVNLPPPYNKLPQLNQQNQQKNNEILKQNVNYYSNPSKPSPGPWKNDENNYHFDGQRKQFPSEFKAVVPEINVQYKSGAPHSHGNNKFVSHNRREPVYYFKNNENSKDESEEEVDQKPLLYSANPETQVDSNSQEQDGNENSHDHDSSEELDDRNQGVQQQYYPQTSNNQNQRDENYRQRSGHPQTQVNYAGQVIKQRDEQGSREEYNKGNEERPQNNYQIYPNRQYQRKDNNEEITDHHNEHHNGRQIIKERPHSHEQVSSEELNEPNEGQGEYHNAPNGQQHRAEDYHQISRDPKKLHAQKELEQRPHQREQDSREELSEQNHGSQQQYYRPTPDPGHTRKEKLFRTEHPEHQVIKQRVPNQYSSSEENTHPPDKQVQQQFQPTFQEWGEQPAPKYRPQKPSPPPLSHLNERIIIKEEAPIEMHTLREEMKAEVIKEEKNNEEDFDKAYKQAAFGFPGYSSDFDNEKDIFNPTSYGSPRYNDDYDIESSPFKEPKEFPTHLSYNEMRDHNTEQYFADFKSRQPKRLNELSQMKENYLQTYRNHQPSYFSKVKNNKPLSVLDYKAPAVPKDENEEYFAQYRPSKHNYEFSKGKPRDSFAHATQADLSYRNKWARTQFEPQIHYGFEPIPRLLDSELAAMASNDSPESEKPTRKKMYKENWCIQQTSTTGGNVGS